LRPGVCDLIGQVARMIVFPEFRRIGFHVFIKSLRSGENSENGTAIVTGDSDEENNSNSADQYCSEGIGRSSDSDFNRRPSKRI
jgi:hypothetical protein